MDLPRLFLRTLEDLERRASTQDEYEALLAASLLRKLLMDAYPLVDQVNAEHRVKLRFPINGPTPFEELQMSDGPVYWSLADGIEVRPDLPPGLQAPQDATRDQLLSRRVMFVRGHDVTVRDLIDQLAHIEGAVHRAQPRKPRELLLEQAGREVFIGGLPAGVRQVQAISRVVVSGLQPLREAVERSATHDG